jgi:hypothetical protein
LVASIIKKKLFVAVTTQLEYLHKTKRFERSLELTYAIKNEANFETNPISRHADSKTEITPNPTQASLAGALRIQADTRDLVQ